MSALKCRFFEDLREGEAFRSPTRTISESDIYTFAGMTGDLTDMHISLTAATESAVFHERPAHGLLLLGIANGLYFRLGLTDGTAMALMGVEWRFRKPGYIGDTLVLVVTVAVKRALEKPDRGLVTFEARLENQRGEVLGEGRFVRLVRRQPAMAESPA
jgi:acyl dehydratase